MQNKACDWICIECRNLNYSFRKICNRCQQCSRDAPGIQFIPNKIDSGLQILETIKLQQIDLGGSNHSSADSNDDDEDNGIFSQALFLQDLSKNSDSFKKSFSFLKKCQVCCNQNYFYLQKCSNCGNSSFN
ncbi:unnamed protein product (macronuclear) [Paramecium tetraurelia]|uniref:RanBP2-type domain-containing protein n=1 Tax=Paramecium tetraurelia TaxID=5888 RepID=A0E0Z1_PARTE|nr:uncharacterized protein GSPATT00022127001 [Paramecium tetraurelia]CAK88958.1 unnamed protein product [Paramecium tetraurelia]|eukprot:XP_001456355.1 hypothetical protein (macronuclear) [Paramecium tetraurelia strain d4-2]